MKRIIGLCVDQERGRYLAIAEGSADATGKPLVADSHQSVDDAVGRLVAQNPAYFEIQVVSLDDFAAVEGVIRWSKQPLSEGLPTPESLAQRQGLL